MIHHIFSFPFTRTSSSASQVAEEMLNTEKNEKCVEYHKNENCIDFSFRKVYILLTLFVAVYSFLFFNSLNFSEEPKQTLIGKATRSLSAIGARRKAKILPNTVSNSSVPTVVTESSVSPLILSEAETVNNNILEVSPSEDLNCFKVITPDSATYIPNFTRRESPWARFAPGSWCRMRTSGISYENGKTLKSVTETKLTLYKINTDGYTLLREVSIKIGPMIHANDPEYISYDFWGTPLEGETIIENLPASGLPVTRKVIPCQVRKITRITPQWKEVTTIYYSTVIAPYVLQRT